MTDDPVFLPSTPAEVRRRGWDTLDIILVTGDAYIDHPAMGVALVGKILADAGFRVGIIGQPDIDSPADLTRLGRPRLFWGVTGGAVDSMVANYTAAGKRRRSDDFTPGGRNDRRPDRAVIAYCNAIRRFCRPVAPIVLGGIEASLRRVAHYDWWRDEIRRSILFDARADYLLYGMADRTVVELARRLAAGRPVTDMAGVCFKAKARPDDALALPSFEACRRDRGAFADMFRLFALHAEYPGRPLVQAHGDWYLIHNPPPPPPTSAELDRVYELPFAREAHPVHQAAGPVRALDTIRFSITSHRGCYGGCRFCAIAVHQGRTVVSRSPDSIVREAKSFRRHPRFRGIISDVGGATANMYGIECPKKLRKGPCRDRGCLFPDICPLLPVDHGPQRRLLARLRRLAGIRRVFVASGIRYDMILADGRNGRAYLEDLVAHHVSGQMKIAPEHTDPEVLALMGKPPIDRLEDFRRLFADTCRKTGCRRYLTYYFIAAHPGCSEAAMVACSRYCRRRLRFTPEQVQIFTPTPSTFSTLMYHTGRDPFTGRRIFVERTSAGRQRQKDLLVGGA